MNSIANELFFITKGKVQLFDQDMNIVDEFEDNEILGFEELNEYEIKKQLKLERSEEMNRKMSEKRRKSSRRIPKEEIDLLEGETDVKRKYIAMAIPNSE